MKLELNQTQKEIVKLLDRTGADNMELAFIILNLTKENQRLSDIEEMFTYIKEKENELNKGEQTNE